MKAALEMAGWLCIALTVVVLSQVVLYKYDEWAALRERRNRLK